MVRLLCLITFAAAAHAQTDVISQSLLTLSVAEQPDRLKILAWSSPVTGLILWGAFHLHKARRKQAELARQIELRTDSLTAATLESQRQLESLAANVPGMIWQMEAKDGIGKITYLSSKSRELFNVDPEEVIVDNNALCKYVHPEDVKALRARQQAAIENAESFGMEFRVELPGQEQRWRQFSAHPTKNEAGDVIWNGITIDITDRKIAELALQEAQHQIQRITENVPGMIYRFVQKSNGSQAVTFVSPKVRDMLEIEPSEALEDVQSLFQYVLPEDLIHVREAITESAATLTPFFQEYRVNLPRQGLRWRSAIGQPSRNVNGDTIWDGVVIDITQTKHTELQLKRANEELARATKMKDEFIANMSHELRTPLSAILGMTEGLQQGIFGPVVSKQVESLDVIKNSGSHLLELINEVLDLAKIESGALELDLAPVNIARLCRSTLKLVAPQAEKKNIELKLSVPLDLPDIEADEKRLRQILVNLLSNAIKFTPDGRWVALEVERNLPDVENHKESLQISVKDNGIGIAPDHIETLFDPFVQVDSSLNREYSGTGLGLSLVKRFAELHAGSVSVRSEKGVGSCFTVDLPSCLSSVAVVPESLEETDEVHQTARPTSALAGNKNIRILLAEDNELVAQTTSSYLTANGFCIELATDGAAAIEAARTLAPDVILMDVQMPVINGFEAIQEIRRIPEHQKTPIIALTGLAMEDDLQRCVSAGADYYLSKPYPMQNLVKLILRVSQSC